MNKLIILALFISTSLQAQINLFNQDPSNQMIVEWNCSTENYPGFIRLPEREQIEIKIRNNGKIKISPNIFSKFKLSNVLQTVGIKSLKSHDSNGLSIDYGPCLENFYAKIRQRYQQNIRNCSGKNSTICNIQENDLMDNIQEIVNESKLAQKTLGTKKLPAKLLFNGTPWIGYQEFDNDIENFCSSDLFDRERVLSNSFLKWIKNRAADTSSHPSQVCMDKYRELLIGYRDEFSKEFCNLSKEVCDFFSDQISPSLAEIDQLKSIRAQAIVEQEKAFQNMANGDWESDFESSFMAKLNGLNTPMCDNFLGFIRNSEGKGVPFVRMTNQISKNMDQLFAKMDLDCQKKFIRQYLENNTFDSVVGAETFKSHCQINKTEFCNNTRFLSKDIESNIERMLELSFGTLGKDYFREQILNCEKENVNALNDLLSKLKDFDEKMMCAPLKVGEGKVVSTSSTTGKSANYSLKRTSPTTMDAYISMSFSSTDDSQVSGKEMEKRAQECLKNASPYLKGANGQSLNIVLLNEQESNQLNSNIRPSLIPVKVGNFYRSNSDEYDSKLGCPAITHEVLHKFGLCDEYQEQMRGVYFDVDTETIIYNDEDLAKKKKDGTAKHVTAYNCRNVAQVDSIMANHTDIFERVIPQKVTCECSSQRCKEYMGANKPQLKDLYLNYGWDIMDNSTRNTFCRVKYKPLITKAQYLADPVQFKILNSSDQKLVLNFKDIIPDGISSIEMTCDCSNPSFTVDNDVKEACSETLAQVKSRIDNEQGNVTISSAKCPSGAYDKVSLWGGDMGSVKGFDGNQFERVFQPKKPELTSLLWPSQFERIVEGACPDKAVLYSTCSQFAYKTELDQNKCNVPQECKDMNKLMGVEQ